MYSPANLLSFLSGLSLFLVGFKIYSNHYFELKKTANVPDDFEHKPPSEYSSNQRMYALLMVVILLIPLGTAAYLSHLGKTETIYPFLPLAIGAWYALIKIGNRVK